MRKQNKQSISKSNLPQPTAAQGYIIRPEFQNLFPAKTLAEYNELKEAIRSDGKIRNPLVIWKETGILIDGHYRHRICKELNITPPVDWVSFADMDEAMTWTLRDQLARRNLNKFLRVEAALKYKAQLAKKAKANQQAAGGAVHLKSDKPVVTREEIAKLAKTSPDTVWKVEKIYERRSEAKVAEAINALRRGDEGISINKVFQRYCARFCAQWKTSARGNATRQHVNLMAKNGVKMETAMKSLLRSCQRAVAQKTMPIDDRERFGLVLKTLTDSYNSFWQEIQKSLAKWSDDETTQPRLPTLPSRNCNRRHDITCAEFGD